jgi:hypothetical protein
MAPNQLPIPGIEEIGEFRLSIILVISISSKSILYLIYDKITLKVYKQIFHPQCINL